VYLILALAATNDLIAIALDLSINDLTWAFRIGIFVAPVLAFFITKRLCLSIQRQKRQTALHGEETSRVVRTGSGEMLEIHAPLSDYDRWILVQHDDYRPLAAGKGVSSLRAKATSFFFKDRIEPVTPAELRAALEHSGHAQHVIDEATGGDYRTPAEMAVHCASTSPRLRRATSAADGPRGRAPPSGPVLSRRTPRTAPWSGHGGVGPGT